MRRIPAIGPLRTVAAALVLISHVAFWTGAAQIDGAGRLLARGDSGVAVFFAISAYLLTRAACAGRPEHPDYVRRRFARIMPAYWCALVGVLIAAWLIDGGVGSLRQVATHVVLLQGFSGESYRAFTQTWSLTTEVTFYALVPTIGAWLRRASHGGRATVLPTLACIALVGVGIQAVVAAHSPSGWTWLGTSALGHAAWFCVGIAWAWISERHANLATRLPAGRALGVAVIVYVLAATPVAGPLGLETPSPWSAAAKEVLYALLAGALLAAATNACDAVQQWADHGWPRAAGDVSYGVFLWHLLVLQVLFAALGLRVFHAPFGLVLIVTVVFTLAQAILSWRCVEQPAIHWAHRRPRTRTPSVR